MATRQAGTTLPIRHAKPRHRRHSLDAASKESGARGRRARGDGDGFHALAEIDVGQVVPHVFGVAAHAPVEVAPTALALVVSAEALMSCEVMSCHVVGVAQSKAGETGG